MMLLLRPCLLAVVLFLIGVPAAPAWAQQPQQGEFIPIDQLPPQDQLPAAPLLIAAYIFALVALVGYLVSVSRRLRAVQQEIARLEQEIAKPGGR